MTRTPDIAEGRAPATWAEWEADVLRSEDECGVVQAWVTKPWFDGLSRLISMQMRGLVDRRDGPNGGPWIITEKGRAERLKIMAVERDVFLVSTPPLTRGER